MDTRDLISIIVPIHNAECSIEKCLDSILGQTYTNIEIILVNDGSVDSSKEICKKYELKDRRIVLISQENRGVSAARNTGLSMAHGKWIMFVDSDDYVENTICKHLLDLAQKTGSDMVQCGVIIETSHRSYQRPIYRLSQKQEYAFNQWDLLSAECWGKLYRRSLIGNEKFQLAYTIGEDLYFNVHVIGKSGSFLISYLPQYHYVETQNSLYRGTRNRKRLLSCREAITCAELDFQGSPDILNYLKTEKLKCNLDICSHIVCDHIDKTGDILSMIKKEIRNNAGHIIKEKNLSLKDKFKFFLIAYLWPVYCICLTAKKC